MKEFQTLECIVTTEWTTGTHAQNYYFSIFIYDKFIIYLILIFNVFFF